MTNSKDQVCLLANFEGNGNHQLGLPKPMGVDSLGGLIGPKNPLNELK